MAAMLLLAAAAAAASTSRLLRMADRPNLYIHTYDRDAKGERDDSDGASNHCDALKLKPQADTQPLGKLHT